MSTILEDPVAREIVALAEHQERRRKAVRIALEAAAMSDDEFAR
ncbi:MAG TPA: hypothetical protein VF167_00035 [Longimicrobiaceae bacterium]